MASLWDQTHPVTYRNALNDCLTADVCVIGAGLAGLTTAYMLALDGRSVVVLEGNSVGRGMSGRSPGHLSDAIDDGLATIERLHGLEGLRLAVASHRIGIETVSRMVCREGIECHFEYLDGYLFEGRGRDGVELRTEEGAAMRGGVEVQFLPTAPLPQFHTGACLRFPYQAQLHPLAYLDGLLQAGMRHGVKVFTDSQVRALDCKRQCTAILQNGSKVQAGSLVLATHVPLSGPLNLQLKQSAWMNFTVGGLVPRGSVPTMLLRDLERPAHALRICSLDDAHDVLLVSGEHRRIGEASHDDVLRYERLRAWARLRFPMCQTFPYRWARQFMQTHDGLAYIGRHLPGHPNVYVATGDSGIGMTHGTVAALLITDLICGRYNPWEPIYHPHRLRLRSLGAVLREDAALAWRYCISRVTGQPAEQPAVAEEVESRH